MTDGVPNDDVLDMEAMLAEALEGELAALRLAGPGDASMADILPARARRRINSARPVDHDDPQAQARAFRKSVVDRPGSHDPADVNDLPLPWPRDWFASADPSDWARCRRLWAQVLWYYVDDALDDRIKGARLRPILISRDFFDVAALVGLDGQAVAERILAQVHSVADAHAMRSRLRSAGAA